MERPKSQIIVIFGASGDLTHRKLIPALLSLYRTDKLPEIFAILGVSRTEYSDSSYREFLQQKMAEHRKSEELPEGAEAFLEKVYYHAMDPALPDGYPGLVERLAQLDRQTGNNESYLFYLATPPVLYEKIPKHLKAVKLHMEGCHGGVKRIIIEKPFGYDLKSARRLNSIYETVFREKQLFRIDHFLGKETVQNILALRFSNGIFEPLWNRRYIDRIEVTAVENLGIESRGGFYDRAGALRDMVQNHLIQLLALCTMEPPASYNENDFRNEVVKIYKALKPLTPEEIARNVIRGQYVASHRKEGSVKGYREEKSVDPESRTETFLAMKLQIANWRWDGVPFFIRTGKQMPTKVTEVVVHFKAAPHNIFGDSYGQPTPNKLVIRIQPNEGVVLKFGLKVPGSGYAVKEVSMDFTYDKLEGTPVADAYARLIEDCMKGDPTLFTRSDAVEASWAFFHPILEAWAANPDIPLYGYPAGTWGPREADSIMAPGNTWSNPCKNLTDTDLYCSL